MRSLPGVEHRLRRSAEARRRVAARDSAFPAAADLTILLDIAPETAAGRKTTNRDKYERDLALLSRVRDSYRRQAASRRLGAARRRTRRRTPSPPTCSRPSRHGSRGCKRADLRGSGIQQHPRARVQRRAGRAHVVDEDNRQRPSTAARAAARTRRARWRGAGRPADPPATASGACAPAHRRAGKPEMPRQFARLIEAARALARSVQRHRNHEIGARRAPRLPPRACAPPGDARWSAARRISARGRSRAAILVAARPRARA